MGKKKLPQSPDCFSSPLLQLLTTFVRPSVRPNRNFEIKYTGFRRRLVELDEGPVRTLQTWCSQIEAKFSNINLSCFETVGVTQSHVTVGLSHTLTTQLNTQLWTWKRTKLNSRTCSSVGPQHTNYGFRSTVLSVCFLDIVWRLITIRPPRASKILFLPHIREKLQIANQ